MQGMGYENIRYYAGGMADWMEHRGPVATLQPSGVQGRLANVVKRARPGRLSWSAAVDVLANCSMEQLLSFWLGMILACGLIYWVAGLAIERGLQAGDAAVTTDVSGLVTAIYFSFVTALSIGYGDVIPLGALRILAVAEGAAGLLIFACVISKLVSRRQEEMVQEIHRIALEERLDRVRTNLHWVFSDFEGIAEIRQAHAILPEQWLRRLESSVRVFCAELQTLHDLLYRTRSLVDEEVLKSLLANLAICLQSLKGLLNSEKSQLQSASGLNSSLRMINNLANEICGACVPRLCAPAMKQWRDQIQALAREIV